MVHLEGSHLLVVQYTVQYAMPTDLTVSKLSIWKVPPLLAVQYSVQYAAQYTVQYTIYCM